MLADSDNLVWLPPGIVVGNIAVRVRDLANLVVRLTDSSLASGLLKIRPKKQKEREAEQPDDTQDEGVRNKGQETQHGALTTNDGSNSRTVVESGNPGKLIQRNA